MTIKLHRFIIFYFCTLGFILNLIWEYLHLELFRFPNYIQDLGISRFLMAILATLGDVVIILLVHYFMHKIYGRKLWEMKWNTGKEFMIVVCAIVCIVVVERLALSTGLWSYSDSLPIVPFLNINLSTFVQFIIVPVFALYISSKLVIYKHKGK